MKNTICSFCKFKLAVCLLIVICIMVFALSALAESKPEYEWRFGLYRTESAEEEAANLFCDLVKVYSNGRMEIKVYPNGSLGTHDEIFHSVQLGDVEMGSLAPYVNLVPGGMLNYMPWTIGTYNESAIAFSYPDGILYKIMSKAWEEVGFHLLYVEVEGPYGLANNIRPIKTPDDLRDIKFRVSASLGCVKALVNMGKGTGMTVATIPWVDIYNALETGVVDGCWDTWPGVIEERHCEVIKYYTALDWLWGAENVVINKDKWDALPSDLKEALVKSAKYTEMYFYEVRRRLQNEYIRKVKEAGVEVYFPTSEEKEQFRLKSNMPIIWEELCAPWLEKSYPGQKDMSQKILDELNRIHNMCSE
jgi:C4-dicarboxylate-binding protein DctP